MKTRRLAPLALVGAILLGTTGCTFITPQATTNHYDPGDGIGFDIGELKVRDALIVADSEGNEGHFSAAVLNGTDTAQTLRLVWEGGDTDIRVPAGETLTLGFQGEDALLLESLDTLPGALASIEFTDGTSSTLQTVPVLDGCLAYYEDLAPTPLEADQCSAPEEDHEDEGH